MSTRTPWCEGCHRTLDEIAAWGSMAADARREVLRLLPERRRMARAQTPHTQAPSP
jgi:predicted Fe-S protein YdhL (DUF1289 family)